MTDPSKLAKIRGLLAKAEATEYPQEAETLRGQAMKLIAKYEIDTKLLDAAKGEDKSPIVTKTIVISVGYRKQQLHLAFRIANALGVYTLTTWSAEAKAEQRRQALLGKRTQPQRDAIDLYGTETTVELVELLFTSLLLQVDSEIAKVTQADIPSYFGRNTKPGPRLKSWRTDWYRGWADKVGDRLDEHHGVAVAEAEEEGNHGTALVLASEMDRAKAFALGQLPAGTKIVKTRGRYNPSAHRAGAAAGERANIGLTGLGGKSKALTG